MKRLIKYLKIIILVISIFSYVYAADTITYISCGGYDGIPYDIPGLVRSIITIIEIIVPVFLIILGAIDFVKVIFGSKEDDLKQASKHFVTRCIAAACVFFVILLVRLLINMLGSNNDGLLECISCFTSDEGACSEYEVEKEDTSEEKAAADKEREELEAKREELRKEKEEEAASVTTTTSTGNGYGKATNISIVYNVKDSGGRCGTGSSDKCSAIATVTYEKKTVVYYMGYQNNSGLLGGSCRAHAFTAANNAIKDTNYSTLDLQNYLKSVQNGNGVLKASGIDKAISYYGLTATVYHSELSRSDAATLIKTALDNGQPVMIFVANSLCSDLAASHHALLLLGYDSSGYVQFIDSCNKARGSSYKKRTISQLSQCLSGDGIANAYYRMIIFSFDE